MCGTYKTVKAYEALDLTKQGVITAEGLREVLLCLSWVD